MAEKHSSGPLIEAGRYGPKAVLTEWRSEYRQMLRAEEVLEIEINSAKGWSGSSLEFLKNVDWIRSLIVMDMRLNDISGVHYCNNLENMEIVTYSRSTIYFDHFPNLRSCVIEWNGSGMLSIFKCCKLELLSINRFRASGIDDLRNFHFPILKDLTLLNSRISCLRSIGQMSSLCRLRLGRLTKLEDITAIVKLKNLKKLHVQKCQRIRNLDEIGHLLWLKNLFISDIGKIDLDFIRKMQDLEELVVSGMNNVVDNDLSFLYELPRLRKIVVGSRINVERPTV